MMTPALQERAKALPAEVQQFLLRVAARHTRHSDTLTLVQVMQEMLSDYQAVGAAIAVQNTEQAADAVRRCTTARSPPVASRATRSSGGSRASRGG